MNKKKAIQGSPTFFIGADKSPSSPRPHSGSGQATWMEWLSWLALPSASVRNLVANNPELRDLNFGCRTLAEGRAANLHHLVYYEMVDTAVGRVVSPASADPGLPNSRPTPIREDHIDIAKPHRRDDLIYSETKSLIEQLAAEPSAPGELHAYPLEPFTIPWSWKPLVPKLVRVAALALLVVVGWQGVASLRAAEEGRDAALETRETVLAQNRKFDEILENNRELLERVKKEEGIPLATLRAILVSMGEAAETLDTGEIEKKLKANAVEYKALSDRLKRLTSDDPEVTRLRQAAQKALDKGRFEEANAHYEAAKARDRATFEHLEKNVNKKRLSIAETASVQAAAQLLQVNPEAYRRAAELYAEAASIAKEADPKVARDYASQQGQTLEKLGHEFGQNAALKEAIAHFQGMLATADKANDPDDWATTQNNLGTALSSLGARESNTDKLEKAVAAYNEALKEWLRDRVPLQWAMTQNNLGGIAYSFVLAQDYETALELADEAIALRPDEIWLYANRAHALTFLGRVDKAKALYLKYRGTKNVSGERSWEIAILDDFAELREAGLTHPLMDEIETLFAAKG